MRIRRLTLAALVILTVLFVADLRSGRPRLFQPGPPSIRLQIKPRIATEFRAKKTQVFTRPQANLTSLVLKGSFGEVNVTSSPGADLVVRAAVIGEQEEQLHGYDVQELISDSVVSYELVFSGENPQPMVGVSYQVEVPAGMEVTVEHNYGEVEVEDFVGFLRLVTRFSNVTVEGLEGSLSVDNQYGTLEMSRISGPVTLEEAFSTSRLNLAQTEGGYSFQVAVTNGSLAGNAPLTKEVRQNITSAWGTIGDGRHPVRIKSSFGSLTINLGE